MGLWGFLNHWWNLPFLVMLGLVGVFFMLQLVGLAGHGDADADVDADVDGDVDADHDAEGDGDHDAGGGRDIAAFFGLGRVPFMVIWTTLFAFAGIAGICVNSFLFTHWGGDYRGWHFAVALLLAVAVGLAAVRLFSRLAARFVDTGGKGSTAKHELAGKIGEVASSKVDAGFGEIRVRDDGGNEMLVHGRLHDGEPALKHGDKVVLVDFDPTKELFWVTALSEAKSGEE